MKELLSAPVGTSLAAPVIPQRRVAGPERRNPAVRERLTRRIRNEFEEMPGLRLTVPQACLLFGLDLGCCRRILVALTESGYLICTGAGQYGRRDLVG